MRFPLFPLFLLFLLSCILLAQNKVYVDQKGILKWTESQSPVALFGVNYTVPFAHSYRAIQKLGLSHKKAIDIDVSQFARLELNAYRIHVWDREVSDHDGNLLKNEHLELLDYLISKLKEKNISIILTPIAWWATGWPEPDLKTGGFSDNYSKIDLVAEEKTRKIQENYIKQFLNHLNPYTGEKYKDDPDIIAFEIINEPRHPGETDITTAYINQMAAVIRSENVTKPVYYNISENWSEKQAAAVYNANIDGISFQWYPTGLVKYSAHWGNYLAHVDHYPVPEINDPKFKNKTRMVYEFDAADIDQAIMYPAMARSFREAGMQWATMFSYDPAYLAAYNTEYSTHYLNLLYTPQKAISLMIAANVFRDVDVYEKFNSYPYNLNFKYYSISYENNLSEMNSPDKFYYTGNTKSLPVEPTKLVHIAGVNSSPLVQSNGSGAYFLDKIDAGIWRLEIYPDMLERMDPFGKNSLDNKVRVLQHHPTDLTISIDDLGKSFHVYNLQNNQDVMAKDGFISVKPGVYILSSTVLKNVNSLPFEYHGRSLREFSSIDQSNPETEVIHKETGQIYENKTWEPLFTIISAQTADTAMLYFRRQGWRSFHSVPLKKIGKYDFSTKINDIIQNGIIEYCVVIKLGDKFTTYPAQINQKPNDWDYYSDKTWKLKVVPDSTPLTIFNPATDLDNLVYPNVWSSIEFRSAMVWDNAGKPEYKLSLTKFKKPLDEFVFQIEADENLKNIDLSNYNFIEFELNLNQSNFKIVDVRLINSQYRLKKQTINRLETSGKIRIELNDFQNDEFVLLPRPYPHFLPYTFKSSQDEAIMSTKLNFLQFNISTSDWGNKPLDFQISSIKLVQ